MTAINDTNEASAVVLISLRLPASYRKALTAKAAQETIRRGERVSVNTLIVEAIEVTLDKDKRKR
jgi:hypothetical protein